MPITNEFGQPVGESLPAGWSPPPPPPRKALIGRYVSLEPIDPDRHSADLYEADAEDRTGEGWTYMPYGPFADPLAFREWMANTCCGDDPQFYAYVDNSTGKAGGWGSYLRIKTREASIEVGHIRLSPKLQRTRMATEAMYLKIRNAFDLGYRRFEWKCDALNAPSRRAAERLGFTFEGTFRQATHYKGRNRDTAWFSITDGEWPNVRAAHEAWLAPANFDASGRQKSSLTSCLTAI
ncbi:MAG: GNAT family protein [Pseudomonadota bacterium]